MNRSWAIVAAALGSCGADAAAQTGVKYHLQGGSELVQTFCLPPCACPSHQTVGLTTGTFTLTKVAENPLFRIYSVTLVDWRAVAVTGTMSVHGSGTYKIGGEVAVTQQLVLDLTIDNGPLLRYDSGVVAIDPIHPFPGMGIRILTEQFGCQKNECQVIAEPVRCPADCDGSGALSVNDFVCFINNYAAADPYANCDGSTIPPTLNVADFVCFLNEYAAGCAR